jgi:hypothetical protein
LKNRFYLPSEPADFAAQIDSFDFALNYGDMLGRDDRPAARERASLAQEYDLTAASDKGTLARRGSCYAISITRETGLLRSVSIGDRSSEARNFS